MFRSWRLWLIAAVTLALLATGRDAAAAPMGTDIATLQQRAKTIVVGTFDVVRSADGGVNYFIDVDTVIRGAATPGRMSVRPSPDGTMDIGRERIVAFIDDGALRWVGRLAAGPSLERGVIRLHGFFDWNAHLVDPGIVTLAGLPGLLATGTLTHAFAVTLAFPAAAGVVRPSSKRFSVTWTMGKPPNVSPSTTVTGLDVKCLGPAYLHGLDWGSFQLSFFDGCAAGKDRRELQMDGRFVGVNPATGEIEVEAVPTKPFVTEREYESFAADGTIVDIQRVVRVGVADGSHYVWRLGEGFVDAKGRALAPGSMSTRGELRDGVQKYAVEYQFGDATITLTAAQAYGVSTGGSPVEITKLMSAGRPYSCAIARAGKPTESCTLTADKPRVVRRKK